MIKWNVVNTILEFFTHTIFLFHHFHLSFSTAEDGHLVVKVLSQSVYVIIIILPDGIRIDWTPKTWWRDTFVYCLNRPFWFRLFCDVTFVFELTFFTVTYLSTVRFLPYLWNNFINNRIFVNNLTDKLKCLGPYT